MNAVQTTSGTFSDCKKWNRHYDMLQMSEPITHMGTDNYIKEQVTSNMQWNQSSPYDELSCTYLYP